jgi:hypothetical protein
MFEKLRRLRDEIRLGAHLARLEAEMRWQRLEPRLAEASQLGDEVATIAAKAAGDIQGAIHRHRVNLRAREGARR